MALLKFFDGTAWKGLDGVAVAASSRSADAPVSIVVAELQREVEALKADLASLRALPSSPVVVAERVTAAEQRADANALSMGQMVMETKNETTLKVNGLQAQINGLASQVAALMVKVG
jgi:hypothetical protein